MIQGRFYANLIDKLFNPAYEIDPVSTNTVLVVRSSIDGVAVRFVYEGQNLLGQNPLVTLLEVRDVQTGADLARISSNNWPQPTSIELGMSIAALHSHGADSVRLLLRGDDYLTIHVEGGGYLNGADGNDELYGTSSSDTLEGGAGADELWGEGGFDFASYQTSTVGVEAYLGREARQFNTGDAQGDIYRDIKGLIGSAFNDRLGGDEHDNHLIGGAGNDFLAGDRGNDTIDGGVGDDTVNLWGNRADFLIEDLGNGEYRVTDSVAGREGTDLLKDVEFIQFRDQTIRLNNNVPTAISLSQTAFAEDTAPGAVVAALLATDADGDAISYSIVGTDGPFTIQGNSLVLTGPLDYETRTQYSLTVQATDQYGGTSTQTFILGVTDVPEPQVLRGTSKNDRLNGGSGSDTIYGSAGNDTLRGFESNDRLHGGSGKDTLHGGNGKDIFVFDTKPNARTNVDRIADFKVIDDTIWLDNKFYKSLGKSGSEKKPAALKKAFFTLGSEAKDGNDYLIYNKKTGKLYYDADGSGQGQQVQIATLSKNLKLTNKDFFVI